MRVLLAALLVVDGIGTALRVAALIPVLGHFDSVAITLITFRALTGALALSSGWWLLLRRPAASPLAAAALLISALLATLEAGAELAPAAVHGSALMRWTYVVASWIYAGVWSWWLRRRLGNGRA